MIQSVGETVISCCGITLPALVPEVPDADHNIHIETIEDEYYVTVKHPMMKEYYISFLAAVSDQGVQLVKQYSQGNAEAYFKKSRVRYIYAYCNHHGLFVIHHA